MQGIVCAFRYLSIPILKDYPPKTSIRSRQSLTQFLPKSSADWCASHHPCLLLQQHHSRTNPQITQTHAMIRRTCPNSRFRQLDGLRYRVLRTSSSVTFSKSCWRTFKLTLERAVECCF